MVIIVPPPVSEIPSDSEKELAIQRRLTEAFINADPKQITLIRTGRIDNGSGGYRDGSTENREVQTMRLIPGGQGMPERETLEGGQATPTHTLLGLYTADVKRWDRFVDDDNHYLVMYVWEKHAYEVKAELLWTRRT